MTTAKKRSLYVLLKRQLERGGGRPIHEKGAGRQPRICLIDQQRMIVGQIRSCRTKKVRGSCEMER